MEARSAQEGDWQRTIPEPLPLCSKDQPRLFELRFQAIGGPRSSIRAVYQYPPARIPFPARAQSILRACLDHPASRIHNPASASLMKLLLIDGHYYVYRSFFAIPTLCTSRGDPTNTLIGFTKTLRLI